MVDEVLLEPGGAVDEVVEEVPPAPDEVPPEPEEVVDEVLLELGDAVDEVVDEVPPAVPLGRGMLNTQVPFPQSVGVRAVTT